MCEIILNLQIGHNRTAASSSESYDSYVGQLLQQVQQQLTKQQMNDSQQLQQILQAAATSKQKITDTNSTSLQGQNLE